MTKTRPLAPTDADIIALADKTRTGEPGREGYILPISFARAVLAKWGAPAPVEPSEFCYFCGVACAASDRRAPAPASQPVAATAWMEPVAVTTEQELLRLHGAPGSMATIFPADASGFPVSLYTFAQVQAMLAAAPRAPAPEPLPGIKPGDFFGGRPEHAMEIDPDDFYGITEAIHHAIEMLNRHKDANTDWSPLDPKRSRRLRQALMAAWILEYPQEAAAHGITAAQNGGQDAEV